MSITLVNKPEGLTPLEALYKLKEKRPEFADDAMTYAGRLDPLASGLLLFLSGEDIKDKDQFLSLPKTYTATILFGFTSDTFGVLGLAEEDVYSTLYDLDLLKKTFEGFVGTHEFLIPPYSSVPFEGKPLHVHAKAGKIGVHNTPKRDMTFNSINLDDLNTISADDLLRRIKEKISLVKGDFRQEEIVARWNEILLGYKGQFQMATVSVNTAGGTYVRSLAYSVGKELGGGGVLLSLNRESIGDYTLDQAIDIL